MKQFYPKNGRVILHIDANSYYASVETAHNPSLATKPLAIAGNESARKGIVITCNYVAREYGICATMPLWEAKKRCRDLIVMTPNFELYRETSEQMFEFISSICPVMEPVSIDECYVDITECFEQGTPPDIAKRIQRGLLEKLKIPVSIGIAPNKFLAKSASNLKKPMGITVLRKRDIANILWEMPVLAMHGIGDKTAEKLTSLNVYSIGELASADAGELKTLLGSNGLLLKERANGIDNRPVNPLAVFDIKSVSKSTTLPKNVTSEKQLANVLQELSEGVSERMKAQYVVSSSIQITIRYGDFKTVTRSRKLDRSIDEAYDILMEALFLLKKHWNGDEVRLLGITAMNTTDKKHAYKQLNLFTYEEDAKLEPIHELRTSINNKFGDGALQPASRLLSQPQSIK